MHEVIFSPATARTVEEAKAVGRCTWRVSSTLFAHVASDRVLQPLGHFADGPLAAKYPAIQAGLQVEQELAALMLKVP